MNVQEKDASFVDRSRRPQNGGHPLVQTVALGTSAAVRRWIKSNLGKLFLNSFRTGAECLCHLGILVFTVLFLSRSSGCRVVGGIVGAPRSRSGGRRVGAIVRGRLTIRRSLSGC